MNGPLIELKNVTRLYSVGGAEVRALDDVSLRIEHGAFVAIMGSSGSGISTLMNVCGCLDRPSSGQYLFEGVDLAHLTEPALARMRSERLGFVFQSFNLLARTSAVENVALPPFYSASGPVGRGERLARARAALDTLGLGGREKNSPAQLSGGQQQRVAIARALINRPGLILADEPTGNLDTRTSHEIMQTLRTLNQQQNVTIVVVTHESDIAEYADRVITMRDGKIISDQQRQSVGTAPRAVAPATAGAGAVGISVANAPAAAGSALPAAAQRERAAARHMRVVTPSWGFGGMILSSAAQAIGRNKVRALLTTLGVFIGVAALIAMVAVGQGANQAVEKQIESLGTNLLVVLPGATTASGVRAGFGSASTLTVNDALADDYEVVFTVAAEATGRIQALSCSLGIPIAPIGRMVAPSGPQDERIIVLGRRGEPRDTGAGVLAGAMAGAAVGGVAEAASEQDREEVTSREMVARAAALERQASNYRRALTACLEGRGYNVR